MSSNKRTHGTAIVSIVPDSSPPTLKCYQSWLPDKKWSPPDEPDVEFEQFGVEFEPFGLAFEPFQGKTPEQDIADMLTCPAGPESIRRSLIAGLKSGQEWELDWFTRKDGSLVLGTPHVCGEGQGETPCLAPLILIRH
jgi:hypothetical protein